MCGWSWSWEDQVHRSRLLNCTTIWDLWSDCQGLLVQRWNTDLPPKWTWERAIRQQHTASAPSSWLTLWGGAWLPNSWRDLPVKCGHQRWCSTYSCIHSLENQTEAFSNMVEAVSPSLLFSLWLCPNSRAVSVWRWQLWDIWWVCPMHYGYQRWYKTI